jgi:hypothetical protein
MGYPEFIMIVLYIISLGGTLLKHGDPRPPQRLATVVFANALTLALLVWGGFFSTFGLAQAIYVFTQVLGGGVLYLTWGDEEFNKNRKYDFYSTLIAVTILLGLYWWGGFFS